LIPPLRCDRPETPISGTIPVIVEQNIEGGTMARSVRYLASIAALALAAISFAPAALAQASTKISITTGGTGGVYYPLGGGMANVLSKYVPGLQATAEVTGGSVDNLKLLGTGKSEVGFAMVDAVSDAAQ